MANPLATIPPALKKVTPYMKRAEELDKDTIHPESKAVAYYCRAYAMDQAMLLRDNSNTKEVMPFLIALMDKLEGEKKTLALSVHSPAEGKALVQDFADKIFTKADEEDQIGVADKNTAKTFYAAGVFYDVMQQFKDLLEPEVEKKRKYCKWKAADILNAIKEGRTPTPGGGFAGGGAAGGGAGGGEGEGGEGGGGLPPAVAEGKSPSISGGLGGVSGSPSSLPPPPPPYSSLGVGHTSPTPTPTPPPARAPSSPPPPPPPPPKTAPPLAPLVPTPVSRPPPPSTKTHTNTPKQAYYDDAKELCYFAISAIQHKEKDLAIERLEKALDKLRSI